MKSIGIDISKNGLTLVEVYADRNHYEILRGYHHPYTQQDTSDWELECLQVLKQLGSEFDFENSTISVGIPQHLASLRNLNFPFHRRMDILKSLPFELDEELPMSIESAIFEGKTTAVTDTETGLLAYAVPAEDIQRTIDFYKKVQIDPDVIGIESSGFANLYEDWSQGSFLATLPENSKSPLVMRVLFGRQTTLLTFFKEQQLVWAHNMSWGEEQIIAELSKHFSMPYDKIAEMIPDKTPLILSTEGVSAEDLKIAQAINTAFRPFIKTLKLILLDIEDRLNSPVTNSLLMGNTAFISNLVAHLTREFEIPFTAESVATSVLTPSQAKPIEHFSEQSPVAVGLALEAFKRPRNPAVNFRKAQCSKKNKFFEKTWTKWGYAVSLCLIAYVVYTVYGITREQIAYNLDDTSYLALTEHAGKIAGLKGRNASFNKIDKFIKKEERKIEAKKIFEKVQDVEPAMSMVVRVSSLLPNNKLNKYDVRRLSVKPTSIQIEGYAENRGTIKLIEHKLKTLAKDKKTNTLKTTIKKEKGVPFAFRIKI